MAWRLHALYRLTSGGEFDMRNDDLSDLNDRASGGGAQNPPGGTGGFGSTGGYGGAGGIGGSGMSSAAGMGGGNDDSTMQRGAERAREGFESVRDTAREKAHELEENAEDLRQRMANRLNSGAERLRQRASGSANLGDDGPLNRALDSEAAHKVERGLADGMESTADWIRTADVDSIRTGIERQVRDHPGRTLLVALGIGYLVGRAFGGGGERKSPEEAKLGDTQMHGGFGDSASTHGLH
jgi:hypothetical protein